MPRYAMSQPFSTQASSARLSSAQQQKEIRRAAMNLLARREHSKKELVEKLSRRFDNFDFLNQQLDRLQVEGLQSDRRFAESYVRYRIQSGLGPQRIDQELRQRGVCEGLLRELLWNANINWFEIISQVYKKKYTSADITNHKEKVKRVRFLQYRGFDFDLIQQLLS